MSKPRLTALYRYPLKSAIGEPVPALQLDALGPVGDRRWMLVDADSGRFLTQRALPRMAHLLARWSPSGGLSLAAPGLPALEVALPDERADLRGVILWKDAMRVPDAGEEAAAWVTRFVGKPTRLVHVPEARARLVEDAQHGEEKVGFADGYPLLVMGQASVDDLGARVGRPLDMRRFRPNLVVEGCEAYAEDGWSRIRIGDLDFRVAKGCSRCILTTIDPDTGERSADREPLTTLKTYREHEGAVYLGQNLVNLGTGRIEVGMEVEVLA
ncbi:MOSC domain-containing protein [Pseudomonas sp. RIT-PI-AD]|uniref:MOSC domain-containing protein n=1 Tax=Pseudomonas sp. RIT-PI-AD TaxID=3035294 RepID=UPI0021DB4764|nr:MOSC domain-containing protein [Pseudomonas sp. RIT-PI-AD]